MIVDDFDRSKIQPAGPDRVPNASFRGVRMAQNQNIFDFMCELMDNIDGLARVVELGTCRGSFAAWCHLECQKRGVQFVTYDIKDIREMEDYHVEIGVDFRLGNIFTNRFNEVCQLIQDAGRTVLLCDNGDKKREVWTFAGFLKPGDHILAHDYVPCREVRDYLRQNVWFGCEITDADVAGIVQKRGLRPFLYYRALATAWLSLYKPLEDVKGDENADHNKG